MYEGCKERLGKESGLSVDLSERVLAKRYNFLIRIYGVLKTRIIISTYIAKIPP